MNIKLYFFSLMVSLLTACATQIIPAPDTYTLSTQWPLHERAIKHELANKSPGQKNSQRLAVLKLASVQAMHIYNSNDIIYSDSPYTRNSYAYSRWNDAPVVLLQNLFQQALESSHQFMAVISSVSVSRADLLLESTLIDFSHHINADGSSSGVISMRFFLIDNSTRLVIKTKAFEATVSATENNAASAVIALNEAAAMISHDLVEWLDEAAMAGPD